MPVALQQSHCFCIIMCICIIPYTLYHISLSLYIISYIDCTLHVHRFFIYFVYFDTMLLFFRDCGYIKMISLWCKTSSLILYLSVKYIDLWQLDLVVDAFDSKSMKGVIHTCRRAVYIWICFQIYKEFSSTGFLGEKSSIW